MEKVRKDFLKTDARLARAFTRVRARKERDAVHADNPFLLSMMWSQRRDFMTSRPDSLNEMIHWITEDVTNDTSIALYAFEEERVQQQQQQQEASKKNNNNNTSNHKTRSQSKEEKKDARYSWTVPRNISS